MTRPIHLHIRINPSTLRRGLGGILFFLGAWNLGSENLTLSTYYPAPSGVYNKMVTTGDTFLARDGGNLGVGTTHPAHKLEVAGGAFSQSVVLQPQDSLPVSPDEGTVMFKRGDKGLYLIRRQRLAEAGRLEQRALGGEDAGRRLPAEDFMDGPDQRGERLPGPDERPADGGRPYPVRHHADPRAGPVFDRLERPSLRHRRRPRRHRQPSRFLQHEILRTVRVRYYNGSSYSSLMPDQKIYAQDVAGAQDSEGNPAPDGKINSQDTNCEPIGGSTLMQFSYNYNPRVQVLAVRTNGVTAAAGAYSSIDMRLLLGL